MFWPAHSSGERRNRLLVREIPTSTMNVRNLQMQKLHFYGSLAVVHRKRWKSYHLLEAKVRISREWRRFLWRTWRFAIFRKTANRRRSRKRRYFSFTSGVAPSKSSAGNGIFDAKVRISRTGMRFCCCIFRAAKTSLISTRKLSRSRCGIAASCC